MSGMLSVVSYGLGTIVGFALIGILLFWFIQDVTQKKHTVLRIYPVVGRLRYLLENWLNVVIICGAAAAALGAATEWIAIVRAMRAAVAVLVLVRTAAEFRVLFTRKGAPMLLGIAVLTLLTLGALFYWLDPNIRTFTDGLWLAFITGATVGYGDVIPTTPATRVLAVLTVLVGVAMMTLFTAHVVTFFVGGEDAKMRDALQREIRDLRHEIRELREELRGMRGE